MITLTLYIRYDPNIYPLKQPHAPLFNLTLPHNLNRAILTAIHSLCPTISSQTGFQNLLCNMTGAALYNLVLLVRQLEVRVAGWITVATGETVRQSDSQTFRQSDS